MVGLVVHERSICLQQFHIYPLNHLDQKMDPSKVTLNQPVHTNTCKLLLSSLFIFWKKQEIKILVVNEIINWLYSTSNISHVICLDDRIFLFFFQYMKFKSRGQANWESKIPNSPKTTTNLFWHAMDCFLFYHCFFVLSFVRDNFAVLYISQITIQVVSHNHIHIQDESTFIIKFS